MSRSYRRTRLATALLVTALAPARAAAQNADPLSAETVALDARVAQIDAHFTEHAAGLAPLPAYTRALADAELLLQLRDYAGAVARLNTLITEYSDSPAYPIALARLGEALALSGDASGARARLAAVVAHVSEPAFRPFAARALERLLDLALRTGDETGLDALLRPFSPGGTPDLVTETAFARGRYYLLRASPDYPRARAAFDAVAADAPLALHAHFCTALLVAAAGDTARAVTLLNELLRASPVDDAQREVLDLAALSLAHLEAARGDRDAAVSALHRVSRDSPRVDLALFAEAWTLLHTGDAVGARAALATLAAVRPGSPLLRDGRLLWGNVLLRTGHFAEAQRVLDEVRRREGDTVSEDSLAPHATPFAPLDRPGHIAPAALAWLASEARVETRSDVAGDLTACREDLRATEDLLVRLHAALAAPARAVAFVDVRDARDELVAVLDRLTQLRAVLGARLDRLASGIPDPTLTSAIAERAILDHRAATFPTERTAVRRRENGTADDAVSMRIELQQTQRRVDELEALVDALERYAREPAVHAASGGNARLDAELVAQRESLARVRRRAGELRARLSLAVTEESAGDPRPANDVETAVAQRAALEREVEALERAHRLPREQRAALDALTALERHALSSDRRVTTEFDRRVDAIRTQVQQEEARVALLRGELARLEHDTTEVAAMLGADGPSDVASTPAPSAPVTPVVPAAPTPAPAPIVGDTSHRVALHTPSDRE